MANEDNIVEIDDWSLICDEQGFGRLTGYVENHPFSTNPGMKKTSRIQSICGDLVRTETGTLYRLLKPSNAYRQYCIDNGIKIPGEST